LDIGYWILKIENFKMSSNRKFQIYNFQYAISGAKKRRASAVADAGPRNRVGQQVILLGDKTEKESES
jgi:hypothetical protein